MIKLKIKKGDTVKVISGKDKGKVGKIISVLPKLGKAVVEKVNTHTKFEKSRQAGKPGKKIEFFAPLPISKLMLIDSNSGQPTRIGYTFLESGGKKRKGKSSGKAV